MGKKSISFYFLTIIITGIICSTLSALIIQVWLNTKLPLGLLFGSCIVNACLHFNLYLVGYRKVNIKSYLYTTALFIALILLLVYGSVSFMGLFCFFAWAVMSFSYLVVMEAIYKLRKAKLPAILFGCLAGGSFFLGFGGIDFHYELVAFIFFSAFTLFPLMIKWNFRDIDD